MATKDFSQEQLLRSYVENIARLAGAADTGKDVGVDISRVMDAALTQSASGVNGSEVGNLKWLAEQLRLRQQAFQEDPWVHCAFEYAVSLVHDRVRRTTSGR